MQDRQCELIRRELDELALRDDLSAVAAEHLQTCVGCREFQRQQTRLRQIVGSLGTVDAPADFDFRLRARLVADSQGPGYRYSSFAVKGLATAAVLVVFGVGAALIWQRRHQPPPIAEAPRIEQKKPDERKAITSPAPQFTPVVAHNQEPRKKVERPLAVKTRRAPLSSVDFSLDRANVLSNTHPALNTATVFPIEASLQSVKVSLDDGRGNARTISFPPISFGTQRVLTTANQFAPKGDW